MGTDKGKRVDGGGYNYRAPPSSLGAGPSSTTWTSRPSEDISRVVSLAGFDDPSLQLKYDTEDISR